MLAAGCVAAAARLQIAGEMVGGGDIRGGVGDRAGGSERVVFGSVDLGRPSDRHECGGGGRRIGNQSAVGGDGPLDAENRHRGERAGESCNGHEPPAIAKGRATAAGFGGEAHAANRQLRTLLDRHRLCVALCAAVRAGRYVVPIAGQPPAFLRRNRFVDQVEGRPTRFGQLPTLRARAEVALDGLIARSAGGKRAAREDVEYLVAIHVSRGSGFRNQDSGFRIQDSGDERFDLSSLTLGSLADGSVSISDSLRRPALTRFLAVRSAQSMASAIS